MAYRSREQEINDRMQAWLGTAIMLTASIFAVLIFADRMELRFIPLPDVWYSTRGFHLIICGVMFACAAILLKSPPRMKPQELTSPIFQTCELLTRPGCELCDDAMQVLASFQDALPTISVVDISNDAQLTRQFGESIPVVILDGRVRFRGAVDRALMQRMVDAVQLQRSFAESSEAHDDAASRVLKT